MLDLNYTTINLSKQQHFLVCKITSNREQLWQFLGINMNGHNYKDGWGAASCDRKHRDIFVTFVTMTD